jgi:hypothetical protein
MARAYLNEKLSSYKRQNITHLSSYDQTHATALIQGNVNKNPSINGTNELQKSNGLLYPNITKFR